jgi:hypothetical protein
LLAQTGQPSGLSPLPGFPSLLLYTQPRQLIAGVAQQGPGAGAIVRGYPPPPPGKLIIRTVLAGRAGAIPVSITLPTAQTVVTAGIRRQGQPY